MNASIRSSPKKGLIETLYTHPPEKNAVICMDEMGPVAAKSYPGHQLERVEPQAEPRRPAQRARQEIDYGRRDKGYVFGAFRPAAGEALTTTYGEHLALNWADFLEQVDEWLPADLDLLE